jgi:DNA repair protein RadC
MSIQQSLFDQPLMVGEAKVYPFAPASRQSVEEAINEIVRQPGGKEAIIKMACTLVDEAFERGCSLNSPKTAMDMIKARIGHIEREVFGIVYLDNRHATLGLEVLFYGTVNASPVYPREVVKSALARNASAVILFHQHPSGNSKPSAADRSITTQLKNILNVVGVETLDHFIIGKDRPFSFAENGMI